MFGKNNKWILNLRSNFALKISALALVLMIVLIFIYAIFTESSNKLKLSADNISPEQPTYIENFAWSYKAKNSDVFSLNAKRAVGQKQQITVAEPMISYQPKGRDVYMLKTSEASFDRQYFMLYINDLFSIAAADDSIKVTGDNLAVDIKNVKATFDNLQVAHDDFKMTGDSVLYNRDESLLKVQGNVRIVTKGGR